MIDLITPIIISYNEERNIGRTLDRLSWAKKVLVIDSGSTDKTREIIDGFDNVTVIEHEFETFGKQWTFGLQWVDTTWALALDSDYVLSDELVAELHKLEEPDDVNAFSTDFVFCVFGKPLKSSLLPGHPTLFRKEKAEIYDDGHAQRIRVDGNIGKCSGVIFHDDRKPFDRWLWSQTRYMKREAHKILTQPKEQLRFSDRIRKTKVLSPIIIFLYTLFAKGLILQGWRGIYYCFQRTLAELILSLTIIEAQYFNRD